jgi:PAS domain S-box-containing protein
VSEQKEILVCEDERLIAFNLKKMLERMGYHVPVTVAYGEKAVECAEENCPDLVLMDIMLKGEMDGIQAAEQITSRLNIPVVYLTSYTDEQTMKRAVLSRSYGYLLKPFQEKLLQVTIELALSKHQVEQQLREREQWLDATLGSIGDAVVTTNREGIIEYLNPVAGLLSGHDPSAILGKPLGDVLNIVNQEGNPALELLAKVLQERQVVSPATIHYVVNREGQKTPVNLTASPLHDPRGRGSGAVLVLRDISRVTDLEKQLRQSQKMQAISTLAGGVAHDFNNILSSIMGYAELSMRHVPRDGPLSGHLSQIICASSRAADLVNQILTFSRQTEEEQQSTKVQPVIAEALKFLKATLPATIEIRTEVDETAGTILADPTQIHQVVMNLCTNAYHAMRENGGVLEVGFDTVTRGENGHELAPGDYVRLTVSDTGCGMDHETMSRIFDPYFTTKPVGEGTGLGLSVIHGIVEAHQGAISVKSRPGKGTRFEVLLPVHGRAEVSSSMAEDIAPTGDERILFVDDEEPIAMMIGELLEFYGYQVTCLTSSTEALEHFRNDPARYDLVITDQTMPKMTGCDLAGELTRIRPQIPIILATGISETMFPGKAEERGIRRMVRKPFVGKEFAQVIRQVLDSDAASRESLSAMN